MSARTQAFPVSDLASDTPIRLVRSETGQVHAEVDHLTRYTSWASSLIWHTQSYWKDLRRCEGLRREVPDEAPATLAGVVTTARVAKDILGIRYAKVRVVNYREIISGKGTGWPRRFTRGSFEERQREIRLLPSRHGQRAYPPHRP